MPTLNSGWEQTSVILKCSYYNMRHDSDYCEKQFIYSQTDLLQGKDNLIIYHKKKIHIENTGNHQNRRCCNGHFVRN